MKKPHWWELRAAYEYSVYERGQIWKIVYIGLNIGYSKINQIIFNCKHNLSYGQIQK